MGTTSAAQIKCVRKYEAEHIKKLTVHCPIEIELAIRKKIGNQSINGYLMDLIKADLGIVKEQEK